MFSKKLFAFSLLFILTGFAVALSPTNDNEKSNIEKIEGKVVDSVTGEDLSGVEVFIGNADMTTGQSFYGTGAQFQPEEPVTTNTNEEGVFIFENVEDGTYTFAINERGYKEWKRTLTVSGDKLIAADREEPVDELTVTLQPVNTL